MAAGGTTGKPRSPAGVTDSKAAEPELSKLSTLWLQIQASALKPWRAQIHSQNSVCLGLLPRNHPFQGGLGRQSYRALS